MKLCGRLRWLAACVVILSALAAMGESAGLCGEWAFSHSPDQTVLTLSEDGSGLYFHTPVLWKDDGSRLRLESADGQMYGLTYALTENALTVYLPAVYDRISAIGGDGQIIGTWKAPGDSQSSFVFTENGKFLEDGVFTGDYALDEEAGSVTLHYAGGFDDTVIFYSFLGDQLVVEYPWLLVPKD